MAKSKIKKFTSEIDSKLYDEMVAVAKRNGQTMRLVLEQALASYLHNAIPSQRLDRSEVMNAFEKSVTRNRDLLEWLPRIASLTGSAKHQTAFRARNVPLQTARLSLRYV